MNSSEIQLRPQTRLDLKWLKTDLQLLFSGVDNLSNCWNGLVSDGELTGPFSEYLFNSTGVASKKGEYGKYYCGQKVRRRFFFTLPLCIYST